MKKITAKKKKTASQAERHTEETSVYTKNRKFYFHFTQKRPGRTKVLLSTPEGLKLYGFATDMRVAPRSRKSRKEMDFFSFLMERDTPIRGLKFRWADDTFECATKDIDLVRKQMEQLGGKECCMRSHEPHDYYFFVLCGLYGVVFVITPKAYYDKYKQIYDGYSHSDIIPKGFCAICFDVAYSDYEYDGCPQKGRQKLRESGFTEKALFPLKHPRFSVSEIDADTKNELGCDCRPFMVAINDGYHDGNVVGFINRELANDLVSQLNLTQSR